MVWLTSSFTHMSTSQNGLILGYSQKMNIFTAMVLDICRKDVNEVVAGVGQGIEWFVCNVSFTIEGVFIMRLEIGDAPDNLEVDAGNDCIENYPKFSSPKSFGNFWLGVGFNVYLCLAIFCINADFEGYMSLVPICPCAVILLSKFKAQSEIWLYSYPKHL